MGMRKEKNGRAREIPTLEEVRAYLRPLNAYFTAEQFHDYYSAIGWRFGQKKIYDWRAVARVWLTNRSRFQRQACVQQSQACVQQRQAAQAREAAQQEWERRYEESRQNSVSYEEYQRMKAAGMV